MTFLELVNDLRREASVSGSGVTTVLNQTGEPARLVRFIQTAYTEIQNIYFDWKFLRKESTFATVAGNNLITPPADLHIWDVKRIYDADGNPVDVIDYDDLDIKINSSETGRPQLFIVKNDNKLLMYPKPDAIYEYSYNYFRNPFKLTVDTDTPAFPEQFHKVIVGRALIMYGNYESAAEAVKAGTELYQTFYPRLHASQAPNKDQTYGRSSPQHIQVVAQ